MKLVYILSLVALMLVMDVMAQKAKKKNTDYSKSLIRLTIAISASVLTSCATIVVSNDDVALFLRSLYAASVEWVLIFLLAFMDRYCTGYKGRQPVRVAIFSISGVSSLFLLSNIFTHKIISCEYDMHKGTLYRMFHYNWSLFRYHAYFTNILSVLCLLILVDTALHTISFYRVKYYPAAIALVATLGMNHLCDYYHAHMEFGLFGYVGLGMFLVYYSVYHTHKGLITSTLSYVATESKSGVACFDIDDKCIYVNDVVKELYPDFKELSDFEPVFEKNIKGEKDRFSECDETKFFNRIERNGKTLHFEVTFGKLKDRNDDYIGCYFYLYDITGDVEAYEEAKFKAEHDELTGIRNAYSFNVNAEAFREKNKGKEIYVIATDIKDFKLINDLFGFGMGNEVLKSFARTMSQLFSENSVCGRMNSDRFAFCVLKEEFDEQKILEAMKTVSKTITSDEYNVYCHFGVYQEDEEDADLNVSVLYDHARLAMRSIKDSYDENFAYYNKDIMNRIIKEKYLVGEFERAIKENHFVMYLQPQVIPGGEVVGAEALVRWKHPEEGMISPGEFIPVFEQSGLIPRLDQYMWNQAAQRLKKWQDEGKDKLHISVNISAKDAYYIDIYKYFTELVEKYEIPPAKLKLELTESAFMNDKDKQLELIAKLQDYGFQVEIDDFGSGYSSLNMLKDMKADVLKIDMGFLRKAENTEIKRTKIIIDVIVELAKKLDMVVVCEGVETQEQVEYLTEAGCDIFQGFFFDRPIEVSEFEQKYMG